MTQKFFVNIIFILITSFCFMPYGFTYIHSVAEINDEYIKNWLVVGPFFPCNIDFDFLDKSKTGGERLLSNVAVDAGTPIIATATQTSLDETQKEIYLTVTEYTAKENSIDFIDAVGNAQNSIAYAFCVLKSEKPRVVDLSFGFDGIISVWLNGRQLYRNDTRKSMTFDSDLVKRVNLNSGENYCLVKIGRPTGSIDTLFQRQVYETLINAPWGFALRVIPANQASIISGKITNRTGDAVSRANVKLEQKGIEKLRTETDVHGNYQFVLYPATGTYDLSTTIEDTGGWEFGIRLNAGQSRNVNLQLDTAISIEGKLLTLDERTPHAAIAVEALRNGKIIARTLSNEQGIYQFINLKSGQYKIRCLTSTEKIYYQGGTSVQVQYNRTQKNIGFSFAQFKAGRWKTYNSTNNLLSNSVSSIYASNNGLLWLATDKGVSIFDGKNFDSLTKEDGLPSNVVNVIYSRNDDNSIWFGTDRGVSYYNGETLTNFTTQNPQLVRRWGEIPFHYLTDGMLMVSNYITSIYEGTDGKVWFGTDKGILQYSDGKGITHIEKEHRLWGTKGLADNMINDIQGNSEGLIWFGTAGGASLYNGQKITHTLTKTDGLPDNRVRSIYIASDGRVYFGTVGGVAIYNKNKITETLTSQDGLLKGTVTSIYGSEDGTMWFGTEVGVSRYDGKSFANFTSSDGLGAGIVYAIRGTSDSLIWCATAQGGISSYNEKGITNFTTKDGLKDNTINDIHETVNSMIWFATNGGVTRYDGKELSTITQKDGLPFNSVSTISSDVKGSLWFGTQAGFSNYNGKRFTQTIASKELGSSSSAIESYRSADGAIWFAGWRTGAVRYDGRKFEHLTTKDGLPDPNENVWAINQSPDKSIWFGTIEGLVRYDGKRITDVFTVADGLVHNHVQTIYIEENGIIWLGTPSGVSKFSKNKWTSFTTTNGLSGSNITAINKTPDNIMWFGTNGAGISIYNPSEKIWMSLDTKDGLSSNTITQIHRDSNGILWFGTDNGVTQYHHSNNRPKVQILSVRVMDTSYTKKLDQIPTLIAPSHVRIECSAVDFKTLPEKRKYRYRIKEMDLVWGQTTEKTYFDHTFDKPGTFTFEVQAIDQDLNISDSARLVLSVVLPWYFKAAVWVPSSGAILVLIISSIFLSLRYYAQRHETQRLREQMLQDLEKELSEASQMQTSLMPQIAPEILGFEIAGRNIPAKEVGGDFFDYLTIGETSELTIVVADVSGKGLRAAMNAVMASGILNMSTEHQDNISSIMSEINKALCQAMEQDMNITMVLAQFNSDKKQVTLANAGQHAYPLLKRNATIEPIKAKGLALGMIPGIPYKPITLDLKSGDLLLFMTDGITEPRNSQGIMYEESGKFLEIVSSIPTDMPIEKVVDTIIQDVIQYSIQEEQDDDITLVAVRVL